MRLRLIFRTLLSAPWLTALKVLSLGLGLAIGSFLLMRVAREREIDTCFPDYDRIYQVYTRTTYFDGAVKEERQAFGQLLELIQTHLSDRVEVAVLGGWSQWSEVRGDSLPDDAALVYVPFEGSYFDVFGLKLIEGVKTAPPGDTNYIWLNRFTATRLFGSPKNAIGKQMTIMAISGGNCVVKGVYEDIPEESSMGSLASFLTLAAGMTHDTSLSPNRDIYLKVKNKVDIDRLNHDINALQHDFHPDSDTEATEAYVRNIRSLTLDDDYYKRVVTTFLILAIAIIFVTVMNYVLVSLSSLKRRSKMIGVQKCCGATSLDVALGFVGETFVILCLSMIVVALLYMYGTKFMPDIFKDEVMQYVTSRHIWVIGAVALSALIAASVVPAIMMARMPVAHVFRRFRSRRGIWKPILLGVETASTALTLGLTAVAMMQFNHILNYDRGLRTEELGMVMFNRLLLADGEPKEFVASRDYVKCSTSLEFMPGYSQWPVRVDRSDGKGSFEAGVGRAGDGFFETTEARLLTGRFDLPTANAVSAHGLTAVAVSRTLVDKMGWTVDDAVGRRFKWSDDGRHYEVVAVYADMTTSPDFSGTKASLIEYDSRAIGALQLFRTHGPLRQSIAKLQAELSETFTSSEVTVKPYEDEFAGYYQSEGSFRILGFMAFAVVAFITAMGLLAYLRDEISRRTKEIAVRKINGATAADIIRLLCGSVMMVSVPAIIVGSVLAGYVGHGMLTVDNIMPGDIVGALAVSSVILIAAVAAVSALMTLRTALDNPVKSLRSE